MTATRAHAAFAGSAQLVASRSAIYRCAAELLGARAELAVDPGVANPLLRAAVLHAMRTAEPLDTTPALVDRWPHGLRSRHAPSDPHVIGTPDAVLAVVVPRLGVGPLRALDDEDDRLPAAVAHLRDGLELVRRCAPRLLADLAPHVAAVVVLDDEDGTCPVQSATLREVPGLLLLSDPPSAVAAAEMFLHEAAHARLFDMMMMLDIVPAVDPGTTWSPPWRSPDVRWPLEQCVAALHAYAVLAELHDALPAGVRVGPGSLLPHAAERVERIGGWLARQVGALGVDAPRWIGALRGRPVTGPSPRRGFREPVSVAVSQDVRVRRDPTDSFVLAVRDRDVVVLDRESGSLLEWLGEASPVGVPVAHILADHLRRRSSRTVVARARADIRRALAHRVETLAGHGLVTITPSPVVPFRIKRRQAR